MKPSYNHTQPGTLMRFTLGGATVVLMCVTVGLAIAKQPPQTVLSLGVGAAILTVCSFLFHSLNVRVDQEWIRIRFGIGLLRKKFRLAEIEQISPTRCKWYNGWGIKKVWGGWLFNVSGFDVVELKFKNGKRALIGTDEPGKLTTAIESAMTGVGAPDHQQE